MKEDDKKQENPENLAENDPNPGKLDNEQDKKNKKMKFKKDNKEEEWQKKLDELNDKYLRLFAEFDNYRKRTIKEKSELLTYGSEDLIIALLPVLDDFNRALVSMNNTKDVDAVKEGITLVNNKLNSILTQKGLVPIEALGTSFNTDFHEAITSIAASEDMKGKIVDEVQKGYLFKEKVIRYAKVVVGN